MMTGKQKLYFLLDRIDDVRAITPSGQTVIIDPTNNLNRRYTDTELQQLFTKLEKDEQVLKVLQTPSRIKTIDIVSDIDAFGTIYDHNDGYWHIELLPTFDSYFQKIQCEPDYQDFTGKKPPEKVERDTGINQRSDEPEIIYEITYAPSREILLNQTFQLAKPDFDSENDLVFSFLYKHPNKKHTLKEIEVGIGSELGKTLHKIVENLGFKGDLRKIFFDVSGTSICFKNPVTKADLEKMGINRIKL